MKQWKRRDILKSLGLAGLVAPVAMYWTDLAEAQAIADRTFMILLSFPNGKVKENPFIIRDGSSFSMADGFTPLEPYKADMIAFEEYAMQPMINEHYTDEHAGHYAPAITMFSGDPPNAFRSGGRQPTIDQIVAWEYVRRGIANPLRKSLAFHMKGSSFGSKELFYQTPTDYSLGKIYSGERMEPVTNYESPVEAFDLLFGDLAVEAGTTTRTLWAQGKSVLDVPSAELAEIRGQLPTDGRDLLDDHLEDLRSLEKGLADEAGSAAPTLPLPERPMAIAREAENHVAIWRQWTKLIEAAIRHDRTRVVTAQFGGVASRFTVPELGLGYVGEANDSNSGSDHHSYTHHQAADVPQFMHWYSERVVELLEALKGGPDRPDLLPAGAVMTGWEFGRNHNARDMPVTLFGECGGYFRPGQVVKYGNDLDMAHKHPGTLLALCHAMGLTDLQKVGRDEARYQQGVAAELRA